MNKITKKDIKRIFKAYDKVMSEAQREAQLDPSDFSEDEICGLVAEEINKKEDESMIYKVMFQTKAGNWISPSKHYTFRNKAKAQKLSNELNKKGYTSKVIPRKRIITKGDLRRDKMAKSIIEELEKPLNEEDKQTAFALLKAIVESQTKKEGINTVVGVIRGMEQKEKKRKRIRA